MVSEQGSAGEPDGEQAPDQKSNPGTERKSDAAAEQKPHRRKGEAD